MMKVYNKETNNYRLVLSCMDMQVGECLLDKYGDVILKRISKSTFLKIENGKCREIDISVK